MTRLIDADDFVHDLAELYVKESPRMSGYGNQDVADMIWEFIKDVNKRPTINAVSVVYCKECKHSWYDELFGMRWCIGKRHKTVKDDWFCADGKKKVEE